MVRPAGLTQVTTISRPAGLLIVTLPIIGPHGPIIGSLSICRILLVLGLTLGPGGPNVSVSSY